MGHGPVESAFSSGGVTYQHERIKCGKPRCGCSRGALHGPYWYAYWKAKGRTRSKYVGKKLPADLGDVAPAGAELRPLDARDINYGCSGQPGGSWRDCGNAADVRLADRGGRPMCASCARKFERRCKRLQLPPPRWAPFER